jgi:hypothetical protein
VRALKCRRIRGRKLGVVVVLIALLAGAGAPALPQERREQARFQREYWYTPAIPAIPELEPIPANAALPSRSCRTLPTTSTKPRTLPRSIRKG